MLVWNGVTTNPIRPAVFAAIRRRSRETAAYFMMVGIAPQVGIKFVKLGTSNTASPGRFCGCILSYSQIVGTHPRIYSVEVGDFAILNRVWVELPNRIYLLAVRKNFSSLAGRVCIGDTVN